MDTVAFTARQEAHFFLLVAAAKIKGPDIRPRIHLAFAQGDDI